MIQKTFPGPWIKNDLYFVLIAGALNGNNNSSEQKHLSQSVTGFDPNLQSNAPIISRQSPLSDDIFRTGAKPAPCGPQDPLAAGAEYHTLGLLRTKPGRGGPHTVHVMQWQDGQVERGRPTGGALVSLHNRSSLHIFNYCWKVGI